MFEKKIPVLFAIAAAILFSLTTFALPAQAATKDSDTTKNSVQDSANASVSAAKNNPGTETMPPAVPPDSNSDSPAASPNSAQTAPEDQHSVANSLLMIAVPIASANELPNPPAPTPDPNTTAGKTLRGPKFAVANKKPSNQDLSFNFQVPQASGEVQALINNTFTVPLLSIWEPFTALSPYGFTPLSPRTTRTLNIAGLLLFGLGVLCMSLKPSSSQTSDNTQPAISKTVAI